jgi:hypothetical protein
MATIKTAGRRFKPPWRFRLRTLLLLFSAIALLCAWEADRLHRRARAVALLEPWNLEPMGTSGDADCWPWSWMPDSFEPWIEPWVAPWAYEYWYVGRLSGAAGSDAPSPSREPTRDEQQEILAAIAVLQEVKYVLMEFPLGDDELRMLSALENLKTLVFTQHALSEKGIGYLRNVRTLQCASIHFPERDTAAMAALVGLKGHPRLNRLMITGEFDAHDIAGLEAGLPHVVVETP